MIKCHHNRIQMQQDQRPVRVTRDMRNLGTEKRQQYQMQNTKKKPKQNQDQEYLWERDLCRMKNYNVYSALQSFCID